jgi:diketogulonate reductase-like aldo/keto reductase
VSNISFEQLATLIEGVEIVPAFVQNRCFARNRWDADVRALCGMHDIIYQGFSLLTANRQVLSSPRLIAIISSARRAKKCPAKGRASLETGGVSDPANLSLTAQVGQDGSGTC